MSIIIPKSQLFKFKHGLKKHPLYDVWSKIKERCYLIRSKDFKHYGARGIKVCDIWITDFKSFYDWAVSHGWKKGMEIDREQNDGDYTPINCRFTTRSQNMRNTRRNNMVTYNGQTKPLVEWSEITGIKRYTLFNRISRLGWSIEQALTTPINTTYNHKNK